MGAGKFFCKYGLTISYKGWGILAGIIIQIASTVSTRIKPTAIKTVPKGIVLSRWCGSFLMGDSINEFRGYVNNYALARDLF
jgi:hypothetical protein